MARILVVDDSKTQSHAAVKMLERNGYEVIVAENGRQGVEYAKSESPDLIIMDVVMPEMNGFQATRAIFKDEKTRHIPVVLCSSKDQQTDIIWGQRQGAREYLVKPVKEMDLISTIKNLLSLT